MVRKLFGWWDIFGLVGVSYDNFYKFNGILELVYIYEWLVYKDLFGIKLNIFIIFLKWDC